MSMLQQLPRELRTQLLGYRLYGTGIRTSPGWEHRYRYDSPEWTIDREALIYGPMDQLVYIHSTSLGRWPGSNTLLIRFSTSERFRGAHSVCVNHRTLPLLLVYGHYGEFCRPADDACTYQN